MVCQLVVNQQIGLEFLEHDYNSHAGILVVYLQRFIFCNKSNLRDLIAATGQVMLLELDSNRQFSARVTLKFDE